MREPGPGTEVDDDDGAPAPAAPVLVVLSSPDARLEGQVIPPGERLRIGRAGSPDLDLAVDDPKLSRAHATLVRTGAGAHRIEDAGSTNGTFVDGLRVRARDLAPGTIVRVGETLFELAPAATAAEGGQDAELVGRTPPLRALLAAVDRVAPSTAAVLIAGPTGSGKEPVARRLHARSGRRGPLVAVNCGAIPSTLVEASFFGHQKGAFTDATVDRPGFFGSAEHGTLFLDEIGALPLAMQPQLLRAIEAREVVPVGAAAPRPADVRVVSATNVDLALECVSGRFRRDLYARLAEIVIEVPALADRRADIPLLVRHFLAALAPERRLAVRATFLERLLVHDFPMNVRELRAAMQHAVLACGQRDVLTVADLPRALQAAPAAPPPATADSGVPGRDELESLLVLHRGNLARVAEHYGKGREQVYRWLRKHGLDAGDYRS